MSDLQLSLLVLGIVVVAGVYAFNWLQERSYRKRAESAFGTPGHDVLMAPDRPPRDAPGHDSAPEVPLVSSNREPVPGTEPQSLPESGDDPIDCAATLSADRPFSQGALDDLAGATASFARPVRLLGKPAADSAWEAAPEHGGARWRHVQVALQLVDRQGVATRAEIDHFLEVLREVAQRIGAAPVLPDADAAAAQALSLDALCAEVDIAIGISVVARPGERFAGTTIRALAEAEGLRLQADGVFHSDTAAGVTQFTLDNQDPEPFFPESIRGLTTPGITLLLDVPRASGGLVAFDRMLQVAEQLARSLGGTLVDDNRQRLDDAGLQATRRALAAVFATMESRGIAPGGPVALRLFS